MKAIFTLLATTAVAAGTTLTGHLQTATPGQGPLQEAALAPAVAPGGAAGAGVPLLADLPVLGALFTPSAEAALAAVQTPRATNGVPVLAEIPLVSAFFAPAPAAAQDPSPAPQPEPSTGPSAGTMRRRAPREAARNDEAQQELDRLRARLAELERELARREERAASTEAQAEERQARARLRTGEEGRMVFRRANPEATPDADELGETREELEVLARRMREQHRALAEVERRSADEARAAAEQSRRVALDVRAEAEQLRAAAESARAEAAEVRARALEDARAALEQALAKGVRGHRAEQGAGPDEHTTVRSNLDRLRLAELHAQLGQMTAARDQLEAELRALATQARAAESGGTQPSLEARSAEARAARRAVDAERMALEQRMVRFLAEERAAGRQDVGGAGPAAPSAPAAEAGPAAPAKPAHPAAPARPARPAQPSMPAAPAPPAPPARPADPTVRARAVQPAGPSAPRRSATLRGVGGPADAGAPTAPSTNGAAVQGGPIHIHVENGDVHIHNGSSAGGGVSISRGPSGAFLAPPAPAAAPEPRATDLFRSRKDRVSVIDVPSLGVHTQVELIDPTVTFALPEGAPVDVPGMALGMATLLTPVVAELATIDASSIVTLDPSTDLVSGIMTDGALAEFFGATTRNFDADSAAPTAGVLEELLQLVREVRSDVRTLRDEVRALREEVDAAPRASQHRDPRATGFGGGTGAGLGAPSAPAVGSGGGASGAGLSSSGFGGDAGSVGSSAGGFGGNAGGFGRSTGGFGGDTSGSTGHGGGGAFPGVPSSGNTK